MDNHNASEFIHNYFAGYDIDNVNSPFAKLGNQLNKITDFRARHTVSAFLLGAVIRKELKLDIRNWIRLYSTYSSDDSFGFFWSIICLLHDSAYNIENNSKRLLREKSSTYSSIASFCKAEGITYNLLEKSENYELIQNYYNFRSHDNDKPRIDHGVIGALLLYDALMTIYYGVKDQGKDASICGMKISKSFPDFCLKISNIVALHNMWRANRENEYIYRMHHLEALIPTPNHAEIIYYENDTLLFLLGLIDTLDPIKAFCNDERGHTLLELDYVVNKVELSFCYQADSKSFSIALENENFERFKKAAYDMCTWLGAEVFQVKPHKIRINIKLKERTSSGTLE